MQNRFLRLKHYRTDQKDNDPKENHATEVLATCLAFSRPLRADFLSFLFEAERKFSVEEAEKFEVRTQVQTDDGGWIDLFLQHAGAEVIVVEVKVRSPEKGDQIQAYANWLKRVYPVGEKHVFSLVQYPNLAFKIQQFGGKQRCTWQKLHAWFSRRKSDYVGAAEEKLIEHLCDYLEAENIVTTWNPNDLLAYSRGIKAMHALEGVFKQLEACLKDQDEGFQTKLTVKDDPWSRLDIGHKKWKPIFGPVGYLNKLSVFFPTTNNGEGVGDQFYFELLLWNKHHRSDWEFTRKKLQSWFTYLHDKDFGGWADLPGRHILEEGLLDHTFAEPPISIKACADDEALVYVTAKDIETLSSNELLDQLVGRVLKHHEIISGLL